MRIPVQIEVEVSYRPPTDDHIDRNVRQLRGEVLIGGHQTKVYAVQEVSLYDPMSDALHISELADAAAKGFVEQLQKTFALVREHEEDA